MRRTWCALAFAACGLTSCGVTATRDAESRAGTSTAAFAVESPTSERPTSSASTPTSTSLATVAPTTAATSIASPAVTTPAATMPITTAVVRATVPPTIAPPTTPAPPLYNLAAAATCTISSTLRVGDVGEEVRCLQDRLDQVSTSGSVALDGTFDAETDAQVRLFQSVHGLSVDGIVGPQTAGQLGIWTEPVPAITAPPAIQPAVGPLANVYYENCDAARAAGAAPVYRGEPGYRAGLDRDDDGVGCE
jgi:hypothetical protein